MKGMAAMSDDEDWTPRWDPPRLSDAPPLAQTRLPMRPKSGVKGGRAGGLEVAAIVLAALLALALAVTLALVVTSVDLPNVFLDGTTTPTTAASLATQAAALTPTSADWYTFTTYDGGFQVDVPGVIGSSHYYFINDFSGEGADLTYHGAPLTTPLQRREAQLSVSILFSTRIADRNICPQGGAQVLIGPGGERIRAWVRDEGRIVVLNLALNGRAIQITLDSGDDAQPALTYDGDIWRHMLASFAPLPGAQRLTTHPCG
jgi:hypothetical protein